VEEGVGSGTGLETVCSGTVGSGTSGLGLVGLVICGSAGVFVGCCCGGGEVVFTGSGYYCWGSSEMTFSEAVASEAISEVVCEFRWKLDWGSSPR
jgi:hypothetical protein